MLVFDMPKPSNPKTIWWTIGLVREGKRKRYITVGCYFDTAEEAKKWVDKNIIEIDEEEE
jgi:hypothetical protein